MNERTKKTAIPRIVKLRVHDRDKCVCIFCGVHVSPFYSSAHVINRSQGGLGIERNIVTACSFCHHEMDNGKNSEMYRRQAIEYLKKFYPDWSRESVTYKKGEQ